MLRTAIYYLVSGPFVLILALLTGLLLLCRVKMLVCECCEEEYMIGTRQHCGLCELHNWSCPKMWK